MTDSNSNSNSNKDKKMNLNEYETRIVEIQSSELSINAKAQALHMTALAIEGAAWNPRARQRARDLSARIRNILSTDFANADRMAGMGELADRGLITPKDHE